MTDAFIEDFDCGDLWSPQAIAAMDIRDWLDKETEYFGTIFGDQIGTGEPPDFLIEPYIVKGTVTAIYGPPGSFKSFLALHAALCIATGLPFNGIPVDKGHVAYIAAEGQAGIKLRAEAWSLFYNQDVTRFDFNAIPRPVNLLREDEVTRLITYLKGIETRFGFKFALIVIDTLAQSIVGGDENSSRDTGIATSAMIRIRREMDTTVVFVHHTGKDEGRRMRGSNAIEGNTDGMLFVKREDKQLIANLATHRQKDAELAEDIRFECIVQTIPRLALAGKKINASLVAHFPATPLAVPPSSRFSKKEQELLRKLITAMNPGTTEPVSALLKRADGLHDNTHYRNKLESLFPADEYVVVTNDHGAKVGTLVRRDGEWNKLTRLD
jgi:hypothetical protein